MADELQLIPADLLDQASDEQLAVYLAALRFETTAWILTPVQRTWDTLADQAFETLVGGSAGPGKTEWLLHRAYRLSIECPGHETIMFRRTYPELRQSLIQRSLERFDQKVASYKVGESTWVFRNGSRIKFSHMEQDLDRYAHQSEEWDLIVYDELVHFTKDQYTYLISRCRTERSKRRMGIRPHVIAGTNPGGSGGPWVKERFVDPSPPGVVFGTSKGRTRAYAPALLDDNPHLDPDYAERLEELGPEEYRALRYGDWDAFSGRYFEWWDRTVHVCEPFEIPDWWPRGRGIDFGFTNPFACVWVAWGPDREVYVYREAYERKLTPPMQARLVIDMSQGEKYRLTAADPSIWSQTGAGEPIATQYARVGLHCTKAMNARVAGWAAIHDLMRVTTADDGTKHTRLHIFNTCLNMIRILPMTPRSERNPEDIDTRSDDHCFVAGTLVYTRCGEVPIEQLRVGDEVWTREGFKPIIKHARTAAGPGTFDRYPVFDVELSNGRLLTGTGNHPVFLADGTTSRLDALRYGDRVLGWHPPAPLSPTTASSSADTPTRVDAAIGSTTGRAQTTSASALGISTRRSGSRRTARSRLDTMSTTSTRTLSTTTSTTWPSSTDASTSASTDSRALLAESWAPYLHMLLPRPQNGIVLPKGWRGIPSTARTPGSAVKPSARRASSATRPTNRSDRYGSARTHAGRLLDALRAWTTSRSSAPSAGSGSPSTGMPSIPNDAVHAHVLSVTAVGHEPVWNITVDECHEYLAEGVLVSNCQDALRYVVATGNKRGREPKPELAGIAKITADEDRHHRRQRRRHPILGSY